VQAGALAEACALLPRAAAYLKWLAAALSIDLHSWKAATLLSWAVLAATSAALALASSVSTGAGSLAMAAPDTSRDRMRTVRFM